MVDPEGDYGTLEGLPGVVVMAGKPAPPAPAELGQLLRYPDVSVVVDVSRVPFQEKREYINSLLPMLASHPSIDRIATRYRYR